MMFDSLLLTLNQVITGSGKATAAQFRIKSLPSSTTLDSGVSVNSICSGV